MKRVLALSVLSCLGLFPVLAQQLLTYSLFDQTAKQYIKVAERGNSKVLAGTAQKYLTGEGAPQDYAEFGKLVSKGAEAGDQWAQLMLGLASFAGRGVPGDFVLAHMWSNLATAGSDEEVASLARYQMNMISQNLSTGQIAKAQELARTWKPASSQDADKSARAEKSSRWAFWRLLKRGD